MINFLTLVTLPFFAAGRAAKAPQPRADVDSADMTLVYVQNDRNVPVTVYVQNDFGEHKLGVVDADGAATLRIAEYMIGEGEIRFFAEPRGELEESTGLLDIHRGEHIGLVVPPR